MPENETPRARLVRLAESIDRRFERIRGRHGERIACRAGCTACCRARLSITRIEAARLRDELRSGPAERRAAIAARAGRPGREHCPALDDHGRCDVYDVRPLICRSFGVPLRRRREVPLIQPPRLDVCDLNFTDTPLTSLPADDVIDQHEIERTLDGIDADWCAARDLPRRERLPLANVLVEACEDDTADG